MSKLESIGYSDWSKSRADTEALADHGVARVVSVHKDSYVVTKGDGEIFAELSGNLLCSTDSASEMPTTGDWVYEEKAANLALRRTNCRLSVSAKFKLGAAVRVR